MLRKLERYVKSEEQGFLKVAMYCGYDDVAPVKNWIRRKSIPKHMETRLKALLNKGVQIGISIK